MNKWKNTLLPVIASVLVTAIIGAGALVRVDRWVQDWLFQRPGVTSRNIVIIGIDEEALDILGPYHTWTREIVAQALEALSADPEKKPAVTAIDILYSGNTSSQADERLAEAAGKLGNVVTAAMAEFGDSITWENGRAASRNASALINYEQPYEKLRECTVQGHINAMSDMDGVLRHALLYVEPENGKRVYSMACETARIFLEKNGQELRLPPVNAAGHFYVPFTGRPGDY